MNTSFYPTELLGFLRRSVDELGQTVVMVTHDPNAAGYADRVVFLADGHIVDEMSEPTSERVLDRMKSFDGHGHPEQGHPEQGHPEQGHPEQGHPEQGQSGLAG